MQWNEPLGNPFDDVKFLQRHRDKPVKSAQRELQIAGVLQTDKIGNEVREFFDSARSLGLYLPKDIEETFKSDFEDIYKQLCDMKFTSYGRKLIKHELKSFLFFLNVPEIILHQFDGDEPDFNAINEGWKVFNKKKTKLLGLKRCPFAFDPHFGFIYDSEKIRGSFKDNVSLDAMQDAWDDAKKEVVGLENKVSAINLKHIKNKVKGVNFDYLSLLMYLHLIEKHNGKGKVLKTYKEMAALWGIPYITFKRKMAFLYKTDFGGDNINPTE